MNVRSHAIGDRAAPGVTITQLDPTGERASVAIAEPGYLLVLAVVPGREIELIAPTGPELAQRTRAGTLRLSLQRVEPDPRAAEQAAIADAAYERCVSMAQEQTRRETTARMPRDSSGKMVSAPPPPPVDPERAAQSRCGVRPRPPRTTLRALPPRTPAERYLVVIETPSRVPIALVQARLDALTAVAADVPGTITAIVEGVLAGSGVRWWGAYAEWTR